jgi:hypothetical protein
VGLQGDPVLSDQGGRVTPIDPEPGRVSETLEERVRIKAFEIYERRGGEHGHALDDWLAAEQEIRVVTRVTLYS